jgi:hypothetical protein
MKAINYKIFFIIFIILGYFAGFILDENSSGGAKGDFIGIWILIQSFKKDFFFTIQNYGEFAQAVWPLFHIFHAYLNPFSYSELTLRISNTLLSMFCCYFFYLCLREKFPKIEKINLASLSLILLISPYFRSSAYWSCTENLAYMFFLLSTLFFLKINKKNRKEKYAILFCIFSSLTLYTRQYYIFIILYYLIWLYFIKKEYKLLLLSLIIYLFLSIPGLYLIYLWNGIFDYQHSEHYDGYVTYKNIKQNLLPVFSVFGMYILFILFSSLKKISVLKKKKNLLYLFLIILLFSIIPYNYNQSLLIKDNLNNINYTLGGGMPIKASLLLFNNFFLLKICAGIGFFLYIYLIKNNLNNFILLTLIVLLFFLPKVFFQEYFDPLIYIIFFLLLDFPENKEVLKKYKNIFFMIIFEILILFISIYFKHLQNLL